MILYLDELDPPDDDELVCPACGRDDYLIERADDSVICLAPIPIPWSYLTRVCGTIVVPAPAG